MVSFIEKDQIKVVVRELTKPAVCISTLELLNICNNDVRLVQIGTVGSFPANFYGFRIRLTTKNSALLVKHFRVRWIKILSQLLRNGYIRRDYEGTTRTKSEGSYGDSA